MSYQTVGQDFETYVSSIRFQIVKNVILKLSFMQLGKRNIEISFLRGESNNIITKITKLNCGAKLANYFAIYLID